MQLLRRGNGILQVVDRLKMLRWIILFIVVLSSFHTAVTRLSTIRIWLCRKTSILFIRHPLHLVIMRIIILKNKEFKLGAISNPTPVYLEELSPRELETSYSETLLMTSIFYMFVGPYARTLVLLSSQPNHLINSIIMQVFPPKE